MPKNLFRLGTYARAVLVSMLLACVGSACVDTYKRDLARAQKAENSGDLYGAAKLYRSACKHKRNRQQLCEHAQTLEKRAIEHDVKQARAACRNNDINNCLLVIQRAFDFAPSNMRVLEVLELASSALVGDCLSRNDVKSARGALAQLRCLQHADKRLVFEPHQARVAKAKIFSSAALANMANGVENNTFSGARYALSSLAYCAAPTGELKQQSLVAHKNMLKQMSIPLNVELRLNKKSEDSVEKLLCQYLAQSFEGAIFCGSKKRSGLSISVDIEHQEPQHTSVVERRQARYHAGSEVAENPEYRAAVARSEAAQRSFERIEQETLDRKASCEAAISALQRANNCGHCYQRTAAERECAAYDAIRGNYNNRAQDQAVATATAQNTSQTVRYDKYENYTYEATLHSWKADFSVSIRSSFLDQTLHDKGILSYQDTEHAGFAPAGVRADPLEAPSANHFGSQAIDRVLSKLRSQLSDELDRRAAVQRPLCERKNMSEIEQLDCLSQVATLRRRTWNQGSAIYPAYLGLEGAAQLENALVCQAMRPHCQNAWVGVKLRPVNPKDAAAANLDRPRGAFVEAVEPESPADKAGMLVGDIVVRVLNTRIEKPEDFGALILSQACSSSIKVRSQRLGQTVEQQVQLGRMTK